MIFPQNIYNDHICDELEFVGGRLFDEEPDKLFFN